MTAPTPPRPLLALILFSALTLARAATPATVLLDDTFEDGGFGGRRDARLVARPGEWFSTGGEYSLERDSGLDGVAVRHTRAKGYGNHVAFAAFPRAGLERPGDALSVTLDFRGVFYGTNNSHRFNFGLLNRRQSAASLELAHGYSAGIRTDGRPTEAGAEPTQFRAIRKIDDDEISLGRGVLEPLKSRFFLNGGADEPGNLADRMRFTLTITRLTDRSLRLDTVFENVTQRVLTSATCTVSADQLVNNDPANPSAAYAFDSVFIGQIRGGSSNIAFDFDNVKVTRRAGGDAR